MSEKRVYGESFYRGQAQRSFNSAQEVIAALNNINAAGGHLLILKAF